MYDHSTPEDTLVPRTQIQVLHRDREVCLSVLIGFEIAEIASVTWSLIGQAMRMAARVEMISSTRGILASQVTKLVDMESVPRVRSQPADGGGHFDSLVDFFEHNRASHFAIADRIDQRDEFRIGWLFHHRLVVRHLFTVLVRHGAKVRKHQWHSSGDDSRHDPARLNQCYRVHDLFV